MGWLTEKQKRKKRRLDLLDSGWFKDTIDYQKRVKDAGGTVDDITCFNWEIWKMKYGS